MESPFQNTLSLGFDQRYQARKYLSKQCFHSCGTYSFISVIFPRTIPVHSLQQCHLLGRNTKDEFQFPIRIRGSKACIFFSTCQIAQFKATICRRCPCQPSTTDTSILPILLRRLLANVFANSLRSNSAPTFALTHKIGRNFPIICLCLSGTDTICKLLSYCCAI